MAESSNQDKNVWVKEAVWIGNDSGLWRLLTKNNLKALSLSYQWSADGTDVRSDVSGYTKSIWRLFEKHGQWCCDRDCWARN